MSILNKSWYSDIVFSPSSYRQIRFLTLKFQRWASWPYLVLCFPSLSVYRKPPGSKNWKWACLLPASNMSTPHYWAIKPQGVWRGRWGIIANINIIGPQYIPFCEEKCWLSCGNLRVNRIDPWVSACPFRLHLDIYLELVGSECEIRKPWVCRGSLRLGRWE